MKKGLKKLSGLILTLVLVLTSFVNVLAYDDTNVELRSEINLNYLFSAAKPYISLVGELKNDNAKLYQQVIEVSKTEFDTINNRLKDLENYKNSIPGGIEAATDEQKAEINRLSDLVTQAYPAFDDTKWSEVSLTEKTDTEYRYGIQPPTKYDYFVVWAKVELNGKKYYQRDIDCITTVAKPPCSTINGKFYDKEGKETTEENYNKICKPVCEVVDGKYYNDKGIEVDEATYKKACLPICTIEGGKYYDNNGNEVSKAQYEKMCSNPKTGNQMYYAYGITTIGVAFVLYMFTRKVRKFSR